MIRAAQARAIRKRYRQLAPVLNEQSRRRFVALEARALGRGGVSFMARVTGLARSTIYHGLSDIRHNVVTTPGRIRKEGSGRKKKVLKDPTLLTDLKKLIEPATRGGRVGMWRGGFRLNISVAASFVWRCLSGSAVAPFPHPAHRTRTCRSPTSGSRTRPHAFTHGTSCPSRLRRTSPKYP